MKSLDVDSFAVLTRTGSVHRVFLTPYPVIDGGGWFLDVDHSDNGQTRQLHTKRGGVRVIYYNVTIKGRIYLALIYPKNEQDGLSQEQKKILRQVAELLN